MSFWPIHGTFPSMLPNTLLTLPAKLSSLNPGSVVLQRGMLADSVVHVESGRVALGLMEGEGLTHLLGTAVGPFWLEATAAILHRPCLVDAVAETEVVLRRLPLSAFRDWFAALPESAQGVLQDVATAHWQQTQLAVSRLAKDAEARCAEWLLQHAEPARETASELVVMLRQRKRLIAAQLGIAPETLSRVLRQLRSRSLISGTGRVLNLLDLNGLRAVAGI